MEMDFIFNSIATTKKNIMIDVGGIMIYLVKAYSLPDPLKKFQKSEERMGIAANGRQLQT